MSDPGVVAAVNATISSIMLAAISIWAATVVSESASQRRRILETADKVNGLPFIGMMGGAGISDQNDAATFEANLRDFISLGMSSDFQSGNATAGSQRFMGLMTALAAHYPFAYRFEGAEQGGLNVDEVQPMQWKTTDEVKEWVGHAESLVGKTRWLFDVYQRSVENMVTAADNEVASKHPKLDFEGLGQYIAPHVIAEIAAYDNTPKVAASMTEGFRMNIGALAAISTEVRGLLEQREAYLGRSGWRKGLLAMAGLSVLSLLCGAVLPVLFPGAPTIVYVWLPAVIYVICGVAGFVALARSLLAN